MADIRMTFKGQEWVIPARKAFEVGDQVEGIVTLAEIGKWGERPRFFQMAKCFGLMLRAAGCKCTDAEVHAEIMQGVSEGGTLAASAAVGALVEVLMGGAAATGQKGDAPGEISAS